jgi:hypothetical protein
MALEFDIRKYNAEKNNLVDGSDSLANQRDQVISFQNIRNKESVFFKAFITAFSDTYSPNFNGVEVFGRTDPIQQYKGTSRSITLAFKVPAASESEAFENLGRAGKLIQMLYPSYASVSNALTLSEAPLVRLKVMNLLSKDSKFITAGILATGDDDPYGSFYSVYRSSAEPDLGILGAITSCTVNHGLESEGAFSKIDETGEEPTGVPNTILPKLIEINVSFTPIHEETIGFEGEYLGINKTPSFPYGVLLKSPVNPASQGTPPSDKTKRLKDLEEKRQAAASAQQAEDLAEAQLEKAKAKMNRFGTKSRQKKRFDAKQEAQSEYDAAKAASIAADLDLATAQSEFDFL